MTDHEKCLLIAQAIRDWHYGCDEGLVRHNHAWSDSPAMSHCICWGSAWRLLSFLDGRGMLTAPVHNPADGPVNPADDEGRQMTP